MSRAALLALLLVAACSPAGEPQVGSQTNWLLDCTSSDECGGLECICGTCTVSCTSETQCDGLTGAACVAPDDERSLGLCGGQLPRSGMCLPPCDGDAGACASIGSTAVRLSIDANVRHQELVGFGASLAYADDAIVAHPAKGAVYDLVFAQSGLDVLRMGNRYQDGSGSLDAAREIVSAASKHLGRTPLLFMTSGTPPASLKASGSRRCAGDPRHCTLASLPDGGFDYAGFGRYWRDSLAAYADAQLVPDYVSVQNNPNWVPEKDNPNDACRFLPGEGTAVVDVDGERVEVAYPGYQEALAAVRSALADLPVAPRFVGPEASSLGAAGEYMTALEGSPVDAFALHLYGQEATAIDSAAFEVVRRVAEQVDRPVFQTEMQADGLGTAVLMHHALTAGGAAAYLQNDLVSLTREGAEVALVLLTEDGFEPQGPYYAMAHFAKHTDPGWIRIDARATSNELLGSAWLSPDGDALSVVLVNPGPEGLEAELAFAGSLGSRLDHSEVSRTLFEGNERGAVLGRLSADGRVHVSARSVMTIALTRGPRQ